MARSTPALLEQLMRFVPPGMQPYRPVLAGYAAMLHEVEVAADAAVTTGKLEGAAGAWLDLHARTYGTLRAVDELDAALRARLRSPEDQVTRPAILSAADRILATYTEDTALMLEGWEGTHLSVDLFAGVSCLVPQKAFVLVVPLVGDACSGASFCDSDFADGDTYAGSGVRHEVYAALLREVQRIKAAGVRWWLLIDARVSTWDYADSSFFDSAYAA